jgi:hypothetical protein
MSRCPSIDTRPPDVNSRSTEDQRLKRLRIGVILVPIVDRNGYFGTSVSDVAACEARHGGVESRKRRGEVGDKNGRNEKSSVFSADLRERFELSSL